MNTTVEAHKIKVKNNDPSSYYLRAKSTDTISSIQATLRYMKENNVFESQGDRGRRSARILSQVDDVATLLNDLFMTILSYLKCVVGLIFPGSVATDLPTVAPTDSSTVSPTYVPTVSSSQSNTDYYSHSPETYSPTQYPTQSPIETSEFPSSAPTCFGGGDCDLRYLRAKRTETFEDRGSRSTRILSKVDDVVTLLNDLFTTVFSYFISMIFLGAVETDLPTMAPTDSPPTYAPTTSNSQSNTDYASRPPVMNSTTQYPSQSPTPTGSSTVTPSVSATESPTITLS